MRTATQRRPGRGEWLPVRSGSVTEDLQDELGQVVVAVVVVPGPAAVHALHAVIAVVVLAEECVNEFGKVHVRPLTIFSHLRQIGIGLPASRRL